MEPVQQETNEEVLTAAAGIDPGQSSDLALAPDLAQADTQSEKSGGRFARMIDGIIAWLKIPRRSAILGSILLLFILPFLPGFKNYLKVPPPHVALSGEPLFVGGSIPTWFSSWFTNSILTTILVDIIIIVLALLATHKMAVIPGRWQSFVEMVMEYLYSMSESVSGRLADKFFAWVATIFVFVIISNWIGLIPGVGSIVVHQSSQSESTEHALAMSSRLTMVDGKLKLVAATPAAEEGHAKEVPLFRAPSADLNTTFALAIATMLMVQVWGVRTLSAGYFKKFFQWNGPNIPMKMISSGEALITDATDARASSTYLRARRPNACRLDGLPKTSMASVMAAATSGWSGVVALWSM